VELEKLLLDDLNAGRYDLDIGGPQAAAAANQADKVLAAMEKILQQMLDLETFNELLDIVRQLQKDQQKLIEETQAERERGLLEELQGLQDLQ
jgi:ATP phosphoribosyltransferase regulatory subunit HisZ